MRLKSTQAVLFVVVCMTGLTVRGAQAPISVPGILPGTEPGKLPQSSSGPEQLSQDRVEAIPELTLLSPAVRSYKEIPLKYTQAGQRVSPPLSWTDAPAGTAEFVLFITDPEPGYCPQRGKDDRLLWLVAKIPGNLTSLPEDAAGFQLPAGARQIQPYRAFCHNGPELAEWQGRHHWTISLFALSAPLQLSAKADHDEVTAAMEGKILAVSRLRPFTTRDALTVNGR